MTGTINLFGARALVTEGGSRDDLNILVVDYVFLPLGSHQSVSDLSSVYTPTPPVGATKALVQCFSQNVRFTLDGTSPTSSVGFQLVAGDPPMTIPADPTATLKFIQESSGATMQLQWGY